MIPADIQQAIIDKATVPIYHESRIAKLSLNEAALPKLDSDFEDITEGKEEDRQRKLRTKWAATRPDRDVLCADSRYDAILGQESDGRRN